MDSGKPAADVVRAVTAGVSRLVVGGLPPAERESQLDELAALYAEQTDVRHPFSPQAQPALRTRAELRAHFAGSGGGDDHTNPDRPERYKAVDVVVHETVDPEVVVVEFSYAGSRRGHPFRIPCIFVARVRDGEIVQSRDYADHLAAARAFGQLDALLSVLAKTRRGGAANR